MLCPVWGMAQGKFTDKLKQKSSNGAVVIVHHDNEIEELVTGVKSASSAGASASTSRTTPQDTLGLAETQPVKNSGPHVRVNGYRIQIYMAGNTAKDKAAVKSLARRFKTYFPDVNAYVYFNSPHWICSVGDYKNREDAEAMLTQVRAQFNSSCIVRSKINYYY